jgi:hypothetical protein
MWQIRDVEIRSDKEVAGFNWSWASSSALEAEPPKPPNQIVA